MNFLNRLINASTGINFEEVLLRPALSDVLFDEVSLAVDLGHIHLHRPLMAAAMNETSSIQLCIAVAQGGGIGIIPKWSEQKRLAALEAVKQACPRETTSTVNRNGDLAVAVTISEEEHEFAVALQRQGADIIVVDSAHGARRNFLAAVQVVREQLPDNCTLIAGNVATGEAADALVSAGANGIKVGLGVGSICTTSQVTGVGMPQLSAIAEVADAIHGRAFVVAEGGFRCSADISKAIACGATVASLGNLFARSTEADGEIVQQEGQLFRRYIANYYPAMTFIDRGNKVSAEGLKGLVPVVGPAQRIIDELSIGIKTAMAFSGAVTTAQLHDRARFIRVALVPTEQPLYDQRQMDTPQMEIRDSGDVGVAVVVWETEGKNHLLLGRRHGKEYALPGGSWKRGEMLSDGACREVREETGIEITDLRIASVHELFNNSKITVGFQAIWAGGSLQEDEQGSMVDLQWVSPDEALKLSPIFASDKAFIRRVLEGNIY